MSVADSLAMQIFSIGEVIDLLQHNQSSLRRIAYDLNQKPNVDKLQREVECLAEALNQNRAAYAKIETTLPPSVVQRMKIEFSDCATTLAKVSNELEGLQNFQDLQNRIAQILQQSLIHSSLEDLEGIKDDIDSLIHSHQEMPLSLLKELLLHRAYIEEKLGYFRKKVHPIMTREKLQTILTRIQSIRGREVDGPKVNEELEDLFNSLEGNCFKKTVCIALGRKNGVLDEEQAEAYGRRHFTEDLSAIEAIIASAVDAFAFAEAL
jgi:hypothetical protein